MKVFALLLAIFALASSALSFKDEICVLPHSVRGLCRAYIPSYSYVADSNECVNFIYGGCGGNANNFDTKEECEEKCKE